MAAAVRTGDGGFSGFYRDAVSYWNGNADLLGHCYSTHTAIAVGRTCNDRTTLTGNSRSAQNRCRRQIGQCRHIHKLRTGFITRIYCTTGFFC